MEKVAQACNITSRRVHQLLEEGLPRAAYGEYDLGQRMAWYIRFLQAALERREIPQIAAALKGERQRLTRAQADLTEVELAEKRRALVPLAMFEERLALMVSSARQRILLLSSRIAPELEGHTRDEIKRKLQAAVHQLLTVLAAGPRQLRRRRPAAAPAPTSSNGHDRSSMEPQAPTV